MTTIEKDVVASLEQAIVAVDEKKAELTAPLDEQRERIAAALEALRTFSNGNGSAPKAKESKAKASKASPTKLSISEERLSKVIKYLEKHPRVRQSELAKELELNGGTVSVAVRVLQDAGKLRKIETEKGSNEWEHIPAKKGPGRPRKQVAA